MRVKLVLSLLVFSTPVWAADIVSGPIEAIVEKVRDGDTFEAIATPWPGHRIPVAVRIIGIDTPEIDGECDAENELAQKAKLRASVLVGQKVQLLDVRGGKYFGRILARVVTSDGKDLGKTLLNEELARPYSSNGQDWCS
jgi:endonuclease YncB( thermonuclease family)